jgi:hypothetical protein
LPVVRPTFVVDLKRLHSLKRRRRKRKRKRKRKKTMWMLYHVDPPK